MARYTVYEDPGHSWAEVPMSRLEELGITGKITRYSYRKGDMAYLEEDCDLTTFARAAQAAGETLEWKPIYQEHCFVRDLPHWGETRQYVKAAKRLD